jgi:hypothetical protein
MGSRWAEDDNVLAAYLGILVYYYESLQTKYDGKVRNVPHPHIRKETEEFRNRQDRVNNFLNSTLVKCEDEETEVPMTDVIEKYIKWYDVQFPGSKDFQKHVKDQLENSKIQVFIKKTRQGNYLKGYRVLGAGETKTDDEEYYTDLFEKLNDDVLNIQPETSTEYIDRLCREYDSQPTEINKPIYIPDNNKNNERNEIDTDSDIDDMVQDNKNREPKKNIKVAISNNISVNLDDNGIKIPKSISNSTTKKALFKTTVNNSFKEFAMMGREASDDSENESEDDSEDDSENESEDDSEDDNK